MSETGSFVTENPLFRASRMSRTSSETSGNIPRSIPSNESVRNSVTSNTDSSMASRENKTPLLDLAEEVSNAEKDTMGAYGAIAGDITEKSGVLSANRSAKDFGGLTGGLADTVGGSFGMIGSTIKGIKAAKTYSNSEDAGEKRMAKGDMKASAGGFAEGAASTVKGGFVLAGKEAAGAVGGAVVGGIQVGFGLKRAIQEGYRARSVSALKLFTSVGNKWKSFISSKKFKRMGVNLGKAALGGLAIAGALATGPIGAGLAIGAAVGGLGLFAYKMYKERKARKKKESALKKVNSDRLDRNEEALSLNSAEGEVASMRRSNNEDLEDPIDSINSRRQANNVSKLHLDTKEGQEAAKKNKKRKEGDGNEEESKMSKARVAVGIHDGLNEGSADNVGSDNNGAASEKDKIAHDSGKIVGALGLSEDEAKSSSGPQLIEKKISVTQSM